MKSTEQIRKPDWDKWRYGERHLRRVGPDGEVFYETVPLRKEDLLYPEEGDRPVLTDGHTRDCFYLFSVADGQSAKHPGRRAFADHRIDFEVPGIQPLGPDLIVFDGVGDWDDTRGTFPVRSMRATPLVGIEVTSPDSRPYDLGIKRDLYFRCGIPWYAIVDRQSGDGREVRVLAYRASEGKYVEVPPDKRGRVWLEPIGLWLGVSDRRATFYDKRGRKLLAPLEQAAADAAARKQAEREKSDLQKRVEELEAQLLKSRGEK